MTSPRLRLFGIVSLGFSVPVLEPDCSRYERTRAFEDIVEGAIDAVAAHGRREWESRISHALFLHRAGQADAARVGEEAIGAEGVRVEWQRKSAALAHAFHGFEPDGRQPRAHERTHAPGDLCSCDASAPGDHAPDCLWTAYSTVRRLAFNATGLGAADRADSERRHGAEVPA